MLKLEGSDIWSMVPIETPEQAEEARRKYAAILRRAQDMIIDHISTLAISYECEEGEEPATMADLQSALADARTDELEMFISKNPHTLFYDGGYIVVRW